ncbi:MAG: phosphodiester glycosidase family protein, partial [Clostridia bacterium]|nr:phosphodiester glycosidase family protein [Clostridia bacterium]
MQFKRVLALLLLSATLLTLVPFGVFASDCDTLGHDLVLNTGKKPTYTEDGWADYYTCTRCDYTDFTILPALGEPVVSDYETFIQNVAILEELAAMYVRENPGKDPAALVIKYIRTGVDKYTTGSWGIMAGYEDAGFATFVRKTEDMINADIPEDEPMLAVTGLKNLEDIVMPNGDKYDIAHVIGTMDITYYNKGSQNHADLSGWAGDLVDLISYIDRTGGNDLTKPFEEQVKFVRENGVAIDYADSGFDIQDFRGDLDAIALIDNFYNTEYTSGVLAQIFYEYYTDTLDDTQRADYYLRNRLNGLSTRIDIREAVLDAYLKNKLISTLESTENIQSLDIANLRKVCCYAFADYVCALAGDYVDQITNDYYEVFSTESSTLAPGITQKKYKATTADGKQTVFYTATADITRDDVDMFANYGDTYPEHGWCMTRVLDQANAAQERYGNPESPDYIENYNVIVSTNGAGFNMQTGEPGGLLVMNGKEYHSINSNGFFGILKDGTPIIATTSEYNTIYKDQVRDGIAGFGSTLIKDGKICITGTSSYYTDRASRTAVGITRTGKVVLMVMDGRQEPLSCGGSMEEIAQVLFDAGCVEAINLDGGGSTTFVARQEGDDELSVINVPSDGIQRSVATSLLMVSTAPNSTAFDHAILETPTNYLTVGSSIQITPVGVSATGNAAELPEGTTFELSNANWGTITEDGVFTAKRTGSVDINLKLGDEIIGSKTVYIIVPDQIYFKKTNVDAVYGSSVTLPVVALYEGKEVTINENDLTYTLSNNNAGVASGFTFTANATSGLKSVTVIAALAADTSIAASITVSLYNQGETTFDFDSAVGGDRSLAWDRTVSNSTTNDDIVYTVTDSNEDMVTSYIFAMDMTQLTIPERLADLTSMLPGSDLEGASAWSFLMQLAERISVLTEVKATVKLDERFDVDYSNIMVKNEYFALNKVVFNEETYELDIILNWIDQTAAIDPDTANPLCLISGVKLTPKESVWADGNKFTATLSGKITYDIYMRASALYSFSQKPENQTIYGIYPFVNPDLVSEKGGHFADTYTTFNDSYTLVNIIKNGWILEDGGYAYYDNGVRAYGIVNIDGYYYDFGENGVNNGQTKYTGLVEVNGKTCYSSFGQLVSGWQVINGDNYYFNKSDYSMVTGKYTVDKLEYTFNENGVLVRGAFVKTTNGVRYYFAGRHLVSRWFELEEGKLWANEEGFVCYGIAPVIYTSTPAVWYHFDETTGAVIGTCSGFIQYKGATYWCDENGNITYGVVDTEGGKIYCVTMGRVVKNQTCYVSSSLDSMGGLERGFYLIDENGYIIKDGFITVTDNSNYYTYYLTDYVKAKDLNLIDGKYYFFNATNGNLFKNTDVWVGGNNEYGLTAGYYHAQEDGSLYIPDLINGEKKIIKEGSNYYFTIDGVKMKSCILELDGEYYYAGSTGALVKDSVMWVTVNDYIAKGYYKFGSDYKLVKTGFVNAPTGYTYYYDNLSLVKGLAKVNGDIYYFNASSGAMNVNTTMWVGPNSLGLAKGYYYFGPEGKMVVDSASVYVDGTEITVSGLVEIRDCWISRGEYQTYEDVKANVVVRVTKDSYRITPEGSFAYNVKLDGIYTVYVRFANGGVFTQVVECDTTTTADKNIITVTDIDDSVRDITVAKGEYSTYADAKQNKVFGLKSDSYRIVDGTWKYMVPENGVYTVYIRYNDGTSKYYVVTCNRGDVATCTKEGNTITFSNLDNLVVLRYISGEYTSSSAMKKAGCS